MRSLHRGRGRAAYAAGLLLLCACASQPGPSVTPWEPPVGFPTEVYPPPSPTLAEGGTLLGGCPNPDGLEELEGVPDEIALGLLRDFWSADAERARRATDPGLWPLLGDLSSRREEADASWLDGPAMPAAQSSYAPALARQCGEGLVTASWTLRVCPPGCLAFNSASLQEDYFLLSWAGHVLIWAIWP